MTFNSAWSNGNTSMCVFPTLLPFLHYFISYTVRPLETSWHLTPPGAAATQACVPFLHCCLSYTVVFPTQCGHLPLHDVQLRLKQYQHKHVCLSYTAVFPTLLFFLHSAATCHFMTFNSAWSNTNTSTCVFPTLLSFLHSAATCHFMTFNSAWSNENTSMCVFPTLLSFLHCCRFYTIRPLHDVQLRLKQRQHKHVCLSYTAVFPTLLSFLHSAATCNFMTFNSAWSNGNTSMCFFPTLCGELLHDINTTHAQNDIGVSQQRVSMRKYKMGVTTQLQVSFRRCGSSVTSTSVQRHTVCHSSVCGWENWWWSV